MPRYGDDSVQQQQQQGSGCWSYESRWLCLATGCAMQVCAGAVYSFGSVAEDLKHNLELNDAHEQGLISISGNLGLWVGSFTGGILADARGPRVSMLGGAVLFFVGYGAMYLALSHRVNALRDPTTVAFFYLLAGLGSGWVMNSVRTIAVDTSVVSLDCIVCCCSAETYAACLRVYAGDVHEHAELGASSPGEGCFNSRDADGRSGDHLVHIVHGVSRRPRRALVRHGSRDRH
jgi:hypothetical protein